MSDPPEKRFRPDGRKILHPKTVLRRTEDLNSALDLELSLLEEISNAMMDAGTLESAYTDEDQKMSLVYQSMDEEDDLINPCSEPSLIEECQPAYSLKKTRV
ncbi:uncharacterized protein LOC117168350 [Belonocnema kinseyi]|uniref:uncharacterized protein LOC117168350 n=1 Tax=Belonocnema kinseyi TaxID=2817044 RepID=UPI00143DDFE2|nr:uncharacterized protein LOC117168350 [Belonocnema kinseyi]